MDDAQAVEHTFGLRDAQGQPLLCVRCPDRQGRPGPCSHRLYSVRWLRFVLAHETQFAAALDDPQGARHELARLAREYQTLPPRHACWERGGCPNEKAGQVACPECRRLREQVQWVDVAREQGRGALVHAPMPSPLLLDLSLARSRGARTAGEIAAVLNGRPLRRQAA